MSYKSKIGSIGTRKVSHQNVSLEYGLVILASNAWLTHGEVFKGTKLATLELSRGGPSVRPVEL